MIRKRCRICAHPHDLYFQATPPAVPRTRGEWVMEALFWAFVVVANASLLYAIWRLS